jgi:hypothetical protein
MGCTIKPPAVSFIGYQLKNKIQTFQGNNATPNANRAKGSDIVSYCGMIS